MAVIDATTAFTCLILRVLNALTTVQHVLAQNHLVLHAAMESYSKIIDVLKHAVMDSSSQEIDALNVIRTVQHVVNRQHSAQVAKIA